MTRQPAASFTHSLSSLPPFPQEPYSKPLTLPLPPDPTSSQIHPPPRHSPGQKASKVPAQGGSEVRNLPTGDGEESDSRCDPLSCTRERSFQPETVLLKSHRELDLEVRSGSSSKQPCQRRTWWGLQEGSQLGRQGPFREQQGQQWPEDVLHCVFKVCFC